MNIGVIVDNDFYNDHRVVNVVKILAQQHKVFVLCLSFNPKKSVYPQIPNTIVEQISINKKFKNILFGIQNSIPLYDYFWGYHIKRLINKYTLQCIYVCDLYMAQAGQIAKRKTNVHLVLDLHENYAQAVLTYKWTQHFLKKILARPHRWAKKEKQLLSHPDKLIVVYDGFKELLLEKYNFLKPENIIVYENVPDLKEFSEYKIDKNIFDKKDRFIIFYFGMISETRGILTSIRAINILKEQYPDIHLLLIGPIIKSDEDLFKKELINDNITHYAWKNISFLPSYINISDVCINPLLKNVHHESTFANKIYQYALYGKPIIVSDCKPLKDFINANNCGLVFTADDQSDLAEKIKYLYENRDKRLELGMNGQKAIEEKYNTKVFKERLLSIYS